MHSVIKRFPMSSYILGGMELLTKSAETQKTNVYWTVVYIKKGIGMYILDSELRCLNEGDMIILPPKMSYSFAAAELGDEYNISVDAVILRFDDAWLTSLLGVFKTLNGVVLGVREIDVPYAVYGPKWMKMCNILRELSSCESSNEPQNMLGLLDLIATRKDMTKILQPSAYEAQTIQEKLEVIDRYIVSNIYSKISLEEIARYVGMNRTYFCMFFKRHYGKGFADYLNDMRIDKAVTLLSVHGKPISDIAKECGYKTAPYFTRAFRKSKGMTPQEFRKKLI